MTSTTPPINASEMTPQFIDHPLVEKIVCHHIHWQYDELQNTICTASHEQRKLMVANLNMCQCCDEHKQRKPSQYGVIPYYQSRPHQEKACKCLCRHLCREICRYYVEEDDSDKSPRSVTELQRSPAWISSQEEREEDWDW